MSAADDIEAVKAGLNEDYEPSWSALDRLADLLPIDEDGGYVWLCNKCGQLLLSEGQKCNSGYHVGPSGENMGEAIRSDALAALLAATEAERDEARREKDEINEWYGAAVGVASQIKAELRAAEKERDQALADVETVGEDLDAALAREEALREALTRCERFIDASGAYNSLAADVRAALAASPEGER